MQLGASRHRILRQLLTEVLLLNTLAALAALLSVTWTTSLLERVLLAPLPGRPILSMFPDLLYNLQVHSFGGTSLNVRVLAATGFVMLLATSLSALAPALYIRHASLNEWLKTDRGMDPSQSRLRRWSLVAQVALSLILLVTAGLFVRSLHQAVSVNFGINTDNILLVSVDLRRSGYTVVERASIFKEMLNRVRKLPQVLGASLSDSPPIGFVGLIVPHAMRVLVGPDHRVLLPTSMISGGTMLVLCDGVAREVIAPDQLPVGVVTALLGGPFFLYLLLRRSGRAQLWGGG